MHDCSNFMIWSNISSHKSRHYSLGTQLDHRAISFRKQKFWSKGTWEFFWLPNFLSYLVFQFYVSLKFMKLFSFCFFVTSLSYHQWLKNHKMENQFCNCLNLHPRKNTIHLKLSNIAYYAKKVITLNIKGQMFKKRCVKKYCSCDKTCQL